MFPNNVEDWEMPKEKEVITWEDETQNETVTDLITLGLPPAPTSPLNDLFSHYSQHPKPTALFLVLLLFAGAWQVHLEVCRILVPWSGIEPRLPALDRGILTTEPPGKSCPIILKGAIVTRLQQL